MPKLRPLQCIAALALLLAATSAQAQTAPPPAAPPPAAAQYTEKVSLARPVVTNRYAGNVSLGATLNGGNTKSYAGTLGGRFQLNRNLHQLTAEVIGSWAAADNTAAAGDDVALTASNSLGRLRYDYFLTKNDALFIALAPRRDRFAGLEARLQTQGGYARNLYAPADNHRLWVEIGYDGTFDNFEEDAPAGQPPLPPGTENFDFVHSARAFVGYTNLLTPLASLNLGVELLYDLQQSDNVRVNSLVELTSSLSQRFKLSLLSRVLYDQEPVPGKEPTDFITTAQLVYTFDSFTPPPACPACDCSNEVAAAKASCATTVSPAVTASAPWPADAPPAAPAKP